MIRQEISYLLKNKLLLLVFVAIIAIPTIYTTLFLGSMWDPYGKTDHLPVAVVNQDKPSDYNGSRLNIGKQMTDTLKEDKSLDFSFVDSKKAAAGLEEGTYYMVITIPEDFSANASTVLNASPQKMELKYETNPGTNYIASKLSETALSKIRASIANSVTEVYVKAVFDQIGTIGNGLTQASEGAGQLKDGTAQLWDGSTLITENLSVLADSSLTFKEGSNTLSVGLKQYTDGVSALSSGASTLKDGLNALNSSTGSLSSGVSSLADGSGQLNSGITAFTDGVSTLDTGAQNLVSNNMPLSETAHTLQNGINQLSQNSESLNSGMSTIASGVDQALALLDSASQNPFASQEAKPAESVTSRTEPSSSAIEAASRTVDTASAAVGDASTSMDTASAANEALINGIQSSGLDETEKEELLSLISQSQGSVAEAQNSLTEAQDTLTSGADEINSYTAAASDDSGISNPLSTEGDSGQTDTASAFQASNAAQAAAILRMVQTGLHGDGTPSNPGLIVGINGYTSGVSQIQGAFGTAKNPGPFVQGLNSYMNGAQELSYGVQKLNSSSDGLLQGAQALNGGLHSLDEQTPVLTSGITQLYNGSMQLYDGSKELTQNTGNLLGGSGQLTDGAAKISSGSRQLGDASATLGEGIRRVEDGAGTLTESLSSAAATVNGTQADETSLQMFSDPVQDTEQKLTSVENNGHAMAPYMMSVALWVAGIAFSIIYPLTRYEGELKSGISWWAGKAVILTCIALLDALVMVLSLHMLNGFNPQQMGRTLLVACLASITFMSIMYFFNAALGKVGSFLMLIYMVVQLSGAAGTYPVELSGDFVAKIHPFLPFTYTVDAFRSTIAGGQSILPCIIMLTLLLLIFSGLTILLFQWRAKRIKTGKPVLLDFLEEKGLA